MSTLPFARRSSISSPPCCTAIAAPDVRESCPACELRDPPSDVLLDLDQMQTELSFKRAGHLPRLQHERHIFSGKKEVDSTCKRLRCPHQQRRKLTVTVRFRSLRWRATRPPGPPQPTVVCSGSDTLISVPRPPRQTQSAPHVAPRA